MSRPGAQDWPPRTGGTGPPAAYRPGADKLGGWGFWWLWSLAIAAAGGVVTVWAEQSFERGVPVLVGVLGGFVVGAVEASIIQRRLGENTTIALAPHLLLAGAGTVLSLALMLSAAMLPSVWADLAAVLCAAGVGVVLGHAGRYGRPPYGTAPGPGNHPWLWCADAQLTIAWSRTPQGPSPP